MTLVLCSSILLWPAATIAEEHVVRIVSDYENLRMVFDPKYLQIEPGDRVTWINEADEEHNVITFPDGFPRGAKAFSSPIMTSAGEQWSYRFEVPGTYEYHCIPHLPMGMHGVILVARPSTNDEFHVPSRAEIRAYRELMMEWLDDEDLDLLDRENRASMDSLDYTGAIYRAQKEALPAAG
jgi:pseudoazurin